MKYLGLIFDMDGVIVDSEPLHVEAEQKTCADYNIPIAQLAWESFKGRPTRDIFNVILASSGSHEEHSVAELVNYKTNVYITLADKKLNLTPGALECLYGARVNFKKVGLATSSNKAIQELVFHKFNLYPYFDAVVTSDEVRNGKPNPEPYITTAAKLNLMPQQCIVVEDSTNGVIAAKEARAFTVGITTSFPREHLLASGADYVVDRFEELEDLITRLQSIK